jgi:ABC-2 type transport system ATP-binding protein
LITCGEPDTLKQLPEVTPANAKWMEVFCPNTTVALGELKRADYVQSATIFGQSIHLLMDAEQPSESIQKTLAQIGINNVEVSLARPSLEDVFVALTKRYSTNGK